MRSGYMDDLFGATTTMRSLPFCLNPPTEALEFVDPSVQLRISKAIEPPKTD